MQVPDRPRPADALATSREDAYAGLQPLILERRPAHPGAVLKVERLLRLVLGLGSQDFKRVIVVSLVDLEDADAGLVVVRYDLAVLMRLRGAVLVDPGRYVRRAAPLPGLQQDDAHLAQTLLLLLDLVMQKLLTTVKPERDQRGFLRLDLQVQLGV